MANFCIWSLLPGGSVAMTTLASMGAAVPEVGETESMAASPLTFSKH